MNFVRTRQRPLNNIIRILLRHFNADASEKSYTVISSGSS